MIRISEIPKQLISKASDVKVILMDVDGVMTSGMIVYDNNGNEIKHFNAHDGLGLKLAAIAGLKTGIISARESGTIRKRAEEIGMDFLYLGQNKKQKAFEELSEKLNLPVENFCFIGDDLPDVPVLKKVGLAVAVANAADFVKENVHYITSKAGGDGAVREVIEIILSAQGKFDEAVKKLWEQ